MTNNESRMPEDYDVKILQKEVFNLIQVCKELSFQIEVIEKKIEQFDGEISDLFDRTRS